MPAKLVIDTIHEAVRNKACKSSHPAQRQRLSVCIHSLLNVTRANGITPSMSSVGCPYDNACAESFFSLLKNEYIYKMRPRTMEEAMELVDEYIHFYNYERIQLASKMTPMEVRQNAIA